MKNGFQHTEEAIKQRGEVFITDCQKKADVCKLSWYAGVKTLVIDFETLFNYPIGDNMKFDVIVGNPPYQDASGAVGLGHTLWEKFVSKSISILKDGGHLCYVHPAGWRDSDGWFKKTQQLLRSKNITYLEIHDRADGVRTFGVQTAYDWYVLQNSDNKGKTTVKSQNGETSDVDLRDMEFIPNSKFSEICSLIADCEEERIEFVANSAYHTQREYVSREKTSKFKYPCVYTILKDGTVNLFYSSEDTHGHFGVPKVIFSNGSSVPIIDADGKYGLTQFSYAIADTPDNLVRIQKAMLTPRFLSIMNECQLIGKHRYTYKVVAMLKKDFWKQFVDENGNEIK